MQDLEMTFGGAMVGGKDFRCVLGKLFGKVWIKYAADREGNFLLIARQ